MAKVILSVLVAFFAVCISVASAAEKPYVWHTPGVDPCNPKVGCTLEWALEKSGWPKELQSRFQKITTETPSSIYQVKNGWTGWMTWGKYSPKFEANTVVAWKKGKNHSEPASRWTLTSNGVMYHLIKVNFCGNWGGWTEHAPQPPPPVVDTPPPPPPPIIISRERPPLGIPPVVACPD